MSARLFPVSRTRKTLMSKTNERTAAADSTAPKQQIGVPFKPGQSGNPAGRPKGSKNKFSEDFWRDLSEVWAEKGKAALEAAIVNEPMKFIAVAAQVLPKDVNVKHGATDAFLNLWKLISDGQAEAALAKVAQSEPDDPDEPVRH
jgi:Family of unknown function (DUF5681)